MFRFRSLRGGLVLAGLAALVAAQGGAFSLEDALALGNQTPAVRAAAAATASARATVERLEYAGDFTISAGPQAKATTEFAMPFPEQTEISGTVSAKMPLGLSDESRLQVKDARAELQIARDRVARANDLAYETVYALYLSAWLAQEEQGVLESELAAARAYSAAVDEQFQAGKVSLVDLRSSEEDLQQKEAAASKGTLDLRLSWLRLATTLGLPYTVETPDLSPVPGLERSPGLPKPPELVAWALDHDVDLRVLKNDLAAVEDRLAILKRPDLSSTVQLSGGVADHSFSISYSFEQPQLNAAYTIPFYSNGTIPGSNSGNLSNTWNVGFSVSLALSAGKAGALESMSLDSLREQDRARFDEIRGSLQLDVRSSYQEWLTALEDLGQAKTAVARAKRNGTIVESRRKLGLASDYEVLQVQALLQRAEFAVIAAESTVRTRFLKAANAAGYLQNVVEALENGGTK